MLAELVDHVIGIDPDRDWITATNTGRPSADRQGDTHSP